MIGNLTRDLYKFSSAYTSGKTSSLNRAHPITLYTAKFQNMNIIPIIPSCLNTQQKTTNVITLRTG